MTEPTNDKEIKKDIKTAPEGEAVLNVKKNEAKIENNTEKGNVKEEAKRINPNIKPGGGGINPPSSLFVPPAFPNKFIGNVYKKREFEIYAFFMSLGAVEREQAFGFSTDSAFAEKYRLHPGTLTEWKKSEDLWNIRNSFFKPFKKYTADIITSLARRAIKLGMGYDVEQWMRMIEGYNPQMGIDVTSKGEQIGGFKIVYHDERRRKYEEEQKKKDGEPTGNAPGGEGAKS
jgi:hypothetical protein